MGRSTGRFRPRRTKLTGLLNEHPEGAYCALGIENTMGCEAGALPVLGRGEEAADSWDITLGGHGKESFGALV